MGYWKTITIEGRPKFWDKPSCRYKLSPLGEMAIIEFQAGQADYDEVNSDLHTIELTRSQAEELSMRWGNPSWVYPTPDGPGYCSIADLRDRGITPDMSSDDEVRKAIGMAKGIIDSFCNRGFFRREARYALDGDGTPTLFLDDRPVISILTLKVDGDVLLPWEYRLYGESGYIKRVKGIFPEGRQNVEVLGHFGFTVIPPEVRYAGILLSIYALRELKSEIDLTKSVSNSTKNALGLKRAKIEDISVEFEYPRSMAEGEARLMTTGNTDVDSMLLKFKKDMDAAVI